MVTPDSDAKRVESLAETQGGNYTESNDVIRRQDPSQPSRAVNCLSVGRSMQLGTGQFEGGLEKV